MIQTKANTVRWGAWPHSRSTGGGEHRAARPRHPRAGGGDVHGQPDGRPQPGRVFHSKRLLAARGGDRRQLHPRLRHHSAPAEHLRPHHRRERRCRARRPRHDREPRHQAHRAWRRHRCQRDRPGPGGRLRRSQPPRHHRAKRARIHRRPGLVAGRRDPRGRLAVPLRQQGRRKRHAP